MSDQDFVLRTYSLKKIYSGRPAVDDVNITIKKGAVYGLIGKNGAGKTTLIRMITSLVHPDSGEIELFGRKERLGEARTRMGSIIETPAFYPNLSAEQNLEYYRIQQGIPDKTCVLKALELVGLSDTGKKSFSHFSLGMKQRLGLALAILGNPDFIILDEPINGLDPVGIAEFRKILKHLNEDLGVAILISSHILSELYLVATSYGIIHDGKLLKEISKDQLDEECRRCLSITVNDIKAAVIVFETALGTTNYKVVGGNDIRLYDHLEAASEVTYQLNTAGVRVSSIHEMGANLEDYFRSAIGEAE